MTTALIFVATLGLSLWMMARELGAKPQMALFLGAGALALILHCWVIGVLWLIIGLVLAVCGLKNVRRHWLTPRLFRLFKQVAPRVSPTERIALEAGTVFWDGELFSGQPDWKRLREQRLPEFTDDEQAFLDNQCSVAASMCNAWEISRERADLPPELWEYLKKERFFGMIIPKEYGGLGFSARAQSAVLQKLSIDETLMVTVGVPNSLGPGELLMKYGTDEQKNHYLPRLADGREIPCFGLTGPRAGSDATSIPDVGVVCRQLFDGEERLGIRLTFDKRWITLAPIATVVGLAFRMFDPDHLLGEQEDIGITCALIPRETEGMAIGRRHHPIGSPFMNGPIRGKDVFIPLDWIIGGPDMAGQGWRMLVECLSIGRCITLPSGSSGEGRYMVGLAGGYTRIRRQFNQPVAEMEGVQEALARIASRAYIAQAAVMHTANMIDHGVKPAVPSVILKTHLTEMAREIMIDAMDVHGGRAVTLGPRNYIGLAFAATPVLITVEGANIMGRSLMIFGQGAIRCHPYVLKELAAKDEDDLIGFDGAVFSHLGFVAGNAARSLIQGLGISRKHREFDAVLAPHVSAIDRLSSAFALCADAAMGSLGSQLKRREMLSARLGDVLSNLYLASMVIKQADERTLVDGERTLLDFSLMRLFYLAEKALIEFLANLPNRTMARALKVIIFPRGRRHRPPQDDDARSIAQAISSDTPLRSRLTELTWDTWEDGNRDNPLQRYNKLLEEMPRAEPIYRKLQKAYAKGELPMNKLHPEERIEAGIASGLLTDEEGSFMHAFEAEVLDMLTVDDFAFDGFALDKSTPSPHSTTTQQ
ncbi:acyl-CoA dehydrogenase [Larsenimonas suaedae]|uniref:Acyl-coenzyme A dehydrogenase n=1 Tax=Larsenimonas suaedae TaxID=1851019 RepID=A0ABU1GW49_9GAMM|nr:acyl-CoA dehydrogenase [Larsenimonas suaedae]MCM2970953.1 acyl-CoA dehydrogenase [Larsenimonas suaedae]MDR5895662.1 acyl-CoA dehydrogenase [Larsenimonas suaedae]